jgi:protein-S-isoprenylcysteine O-methyltransferase Ste14
MIGRKPPADRSLPRIDASEVSEPEVDKGVAIQWGVGCLVGAVALVGVVLLSALIAFYLQPPAWIQVALGVILALGGALLAWLVATAWGRSSPERRPPVR